MNFEQILNSNLNKTNKAKALFNLGYTRKEVANLVLAGNYGFAQNIFVKWAAERIINQPNSPFNFLFNRSFGVEIEAYGIEKAVLGRKLNEAGIATEVEGYNHTTRNHWKIVTDSSITGNNGFEVVSPILKGEDGLRQLEKVCTVLKQCNALINKSCGLHIHFGARDLTIENWRNLYWNYAKLEPKIDAFMPQSRRGNENTYCKSLTNLVTQHKLNNCQTLQQIQREITSNSRYYKLNTKSFERHGTVEFRQHSGTIEYQKVSNWILFLAQLVEYTKQLGKTENFTDFCATEQQTFYANRTSQLS